jgi:hypothetical protein
MLRRVLEGDSAASLPMVLLVSHIRTRGRPQQQQQQQQQQAAEEAAGGSRQGGALEAGVDVTGIELSDGWYSMNAVLDAPLTQLVLSAHIRVSGD